MSAPPPGIRPSPASTSEPSVDDALLREATAALREHVDPRWVEIADRVVLKALSATRRSLPIRAADDGLGRIEISEHVLVAAVRDALVDVPASLPTRIRVVGDPRGHYTGITIEITVQYGHEVLPIADAVRERAQLALTDLLGAVTPTVTVTTMHVHVGDVTTGDPKLG